MAGGLLGLDLATCSGWACGRIPARAATALEIAARQPQQPASGIIRVQSLQSLGHFLSEFEDRICGLLDQHQPAGVVYEAPILPKVCNYETSCKLMSLAGIMLVQVSRRGISWVKKVQPSTAKKHFAGSGRAEKGDMKAACDARGWTYRDDNEADALGIWDLGCELYRKGMRK